MICSECKRDGWLQLLRVAIPFAAKIRLLRFADYLIQVHVRAIQARHPHLRNKPQEW